MLYNIVLILLLLLIIILRHKKFIKHTQFVYIFIIITLFYILHNKSPIYESFITGIIVEEELKPVQEENKNVQPPTPRPTQTPTKPPTVEEEVNKKLKPSKYPMFYNDSNMHVVQEELNIGPIADNILLNFKMNGYNGKKADRLSDIVKTKRTILYYTQKNKIINSENDLKKYLMNNKNNIEFIRKQTKYDILEFSEYYNTCLENFIIDNLNLNINGIAISQNTYKEELLKFIYNDYKNIFALTTKLNNKFIYSKLSKTIHTQICDNLNNNNNSFINKICLFFNNKNNDVIFNTYLDPVIVEEEHTTIKKDHIQLIKNQLFKNPFYLLFLVNIPEFIITEMYNLTVNDLKKDLTGDISFLDNIEVIESFTDMNNQAICNTCNTSLCNNTNIKDCTIDNVIGFIKQILTIISDYFTLKNYNYNKLILTQIQNFYYDEYVEEYDTINDEKIISDLLEIFQSIYRDKYMDNDFYTSTFNSEFWENNWTYDRLKTVFHPFYLFTNKKSPLYSHIHVNSDCMKCLLENEIFNDIIMIDNVIEFIYTCKNEYEYMKQNTVAKSSDLKCKINTISIKSNDFFVKLWTDPDNTDPNKRGPAFPILIKGSGIQFINNDAIIHRIKYFKKYNTYLETVIDTGDILPSKTSNIIRLFETGTYSFTFYNDYNPHTIDILVIDNIDSSKLQYGSKNLSLDELQSLTTDTCKQMGIQKPNPPNIQYNNVMWSGKCDSTTCNNLGFNTTSSTKWNKEYAFTCGQNNCESDKTIPYGPVNFNKDGKEGGNPFISLNNISADAEDYKPICENNNYINIYRRDYGEKNWNKIDVLNSDYTSYNGVNNIFFDNNKDKTKRDVGFISNAKVINNNKPIIDNYLKTETQICAFPSVVKDNVTIFLNKLDKIYDEIIEE